MTNKNIYDLKLHEVSVVECESLFTLALRVPGGWIYRSYDKGSNILSAVFVRFDNEFQPSPTQANESQTEEK